ncbi:flagellin lysine-N-methylase [Viridibacillus sp. NPDC093762]|uniref:flagellin lysine-N-methylase n=1 Tax=Viridibacillus sp. NPDC093762 TaxID=3390720 RepID=UPI003D03C323
MTQKTKTRPILTPQYMSDFSCIGSACEDTCCAGWRVEIDEDTYKQYRKTRDIELKPLLDKKVTRQRSKASSAAYAKIQMDKEGKCSFLNEENLCKIQLNLGPDLLSNTCAIYPRTLNKVNGIIEKSLTLSCPEAARLALLNPKGMEFEQLEEHSDTRGYISKQMVTTNPKLKINVQSYFWELRIFSIQVLQDRSYTLSERLIIVGMFIKKVQELVDNGDVHLIPDNIVRYTNLMANKGIKELLSTVSSNIQIQIELCKVLVDARFKQGVNNPRYIECLQEMLLGIQYTEEAKIEEVTKKYEESYELFYEPFMSEHEYILENYLVNHVFKNMFPLGLKTPFEDYVMLVIHYSMIKLHLIGLAGFHKGLTTDIVIKLIQSFAKTIEHNGNYLSKVSDFLKDNGFNTMAYMTILVKN